MRPVVVSSRVISFVAGAILASASWAAAQQPSAQGKTAEQVYKNIQSLKGTLADQFTPVMQLIQADLGVDCVFCHIEEDRSKDDKETKRTARKMIQMVMDINKNSFEGRPEVTCYTCHRGTHDPSNIPALGSVVISREAEGAPAPLPLPSVDQILSRYVAALGGDQAIRKVTSRVVTGTQDIPTGPGGIIPMPAQTERSTKAPNLLVNVYKTPTYPIADGFDGTSEWAQDMRGRVAEVAPMDQARAKRSADFYEPLNLKQEYTRMEVRARDTIGEHEVYVVYGFLQSGPAERLFFDVQTGLLLRRRTLMPTALGNTPFDVDYDDYRTTQSGTKFPFSIRTTPAFPARSELDISTTFLVQKVQENVALDDAKFKRPESK